MPRVEVMPGGDVCYPYDFGVGKSCGRRDTGYWDLC